MPLLANGVRRPATIATRRSRTRSRACCPGMRMSRSYPFLARMLATARHRSASTGSSTSRPCSTRNGLTRRASSPGWRRWFSDDRPPAEFALGGEKRFDHEETAGGDELADLRQPRPVKIIEHQNRIKRAEVGPRPLEIHDAPVDGRAPSTRRARAPWQAAPRPCPRPPPTRPAAAAASACRPSPHARSSTRTPGPNR